MIKNILNKKAIQPFLEKNFDKKRKAISPLIATILLIVVAVAIIGIIVSWGKGFTTDSLSQTQNVADLKVNDATHFVFRPEYRGSNLTFTYSPPSNLKNTEITIDRYTLSGSSEIYDLNTPIVLRDGLNSVVDLNLDMFTIVDRQIDIILISTNDEYITLRKTNYLEYAGCPSCSECSSFIFEGDAVVSDIKTGSTFYSDSNVLLTGTGTKFLSPFSSVVSAGYYDSNNLTSIDSNLTASNIVEGVNIFGVVGTASSGPETIVPLNLPYVYYPPGQTNTVLYIHTTDAPTALTWDDAVSYCAFMNSVDGLGYDDWYLPDAAQMMAIWLACPDQDKTNTCMNTNIQNKITGWSDIIISDYWTKTEYSSPYAYAYYLSYGYIGYGDKSDYGYLRCVRDH